MSNHEFDYLALPPHAQHYLHSLELHAIIRCMRDNFQMPKAIIIPFVRDTLVQPDSPHNHQIESFLETRHNMLMDKEEVALYYLTAGCGINKVCKLANLGQASVYKIRENPNWDIRTTGLSSAFLADGHILRAIQNWTNALNIFEGYRVTDSSHVHELYANHEVNFKRRPAPKKDFKQMLNDIHK